MTQIDDIIAIVKRYAGSVCDFAEIEREVAAYLSAKGAGDVEKMREALERCDVMFSLDIPHLFEWNGEEFNQAVYDTKQRVAAALASVSQGGEKRACTCHPDDNPPKPCAEKYALTECQAPSPRVDDAEVAGLVAKWKKWAEDDKATLALKKREAERSHDWVVANRVIHCEDTIAVANLIEQQAAALSRLAGQEAVEWRSGRQHTVHKDIADAWRENGMLVEPLYPAPQPSPDVEKITRERDEWEQAAAVEANARREAQAEAERLRKLLDETHEHMHQLCAIIPGNDQAYKRNTALMAAIRARAALPAGGKEDGE